MGMDYGHVVTLGLILLLVSVILKAWHLEIEKVHENNKKLQLEITTCQTRLENLNEQNFDWKTDAQLCSVEKSS